jgi:Cu(I)/Ag(I) efflux system membrane fusion protein
MGNQNNQLGSIAADALVRHGRQILLTLGVLLAIIASSTLYIRQSHQRRSQSESRDSEKTVYACPMHASVRSDHPGACPICGMALVAITNGKEDAGHVQVDRIMLSDQQFASAHVRLATVHSMEFAAEIEVAAKISWDESRFSKIITRVAGRIVSIRAPAVGSYISSGQVAYVINSPDLIAAQKEYLLSSGQDEHHHDGMTSMATQDSLLDFSQAAYSRLQNLGMSRAQLRELEQSKQVQQSVQIEAGSAGYVTEKLVTSGAWVQENTTILSLASPSTAWVLADIYQKDIERVHVGASAAVTTNAYPGRVFNGTVTTIYPALDTETHTEKIRIEVPNGSGTLKPEMIAHAVIYGQRRHALVVPEDAVLFSGGSAHVWVKNENESYQGRFVVVGEQANGAYEILSGVQEGEQVVAAAGYLLDSEAHLKKLESNRGPDR